MDEKLVTFDKRKHPELYDLLISLGVYILYDKESISLKDLETLYSELGQILKDCEPV